MRRERGSVSVHAVWVTVLLLVLTLVALQVADLVRLRHRASAAADLAALAASRASVSGDDGCAAARDVARRNGADLTGCRMDLDVATVAATVEADPWWGGSWTSTVRARAAPSWYER